MKLDEPNAPEECAKILAVVARMKVATEYGQESLLVWGHEWMMVKETFWQ